MLWQRIRDLGRQPDVQMLPTPAAIQDAVLLSAETDAMLDEDPLLQQSYWSAIDQILRTAKAADLLPLRKLQEGKIRSLSRAIHQTGEAAESVRLFRRYPWAHSAQELLVEFAEDALRNGRPNWAARSFQDVLTHADDPVVLAQARVGSWLALAGTADWRDELERAMSVVPDDTMLPWRGGMAKAADIKTAIRMPLLSADVPSPPPLSSVRRVKVRLPAAFAAVEPVAPNQQFISSGLGAWTIRRIESASDLFVVIGSRHVACYDAGTMKLLRLCGTPLCSDPSWVEPVWRPAILGRSWNTAIGGRDGLSSRCPLIYSMKVSTRTAALEYDVAAWDAGTGRMLWSTGGRDEWKELRLQSEPVAGEGCLFVLATARKGAGNLPLYLVCMDSGSGAIAWQRLLGSLPGDNRLRNITLAGGTITLCHGALYVSTDLGIVACCDARDGALDWVRIYPSSLMDEHAAIQYQRDGTAPLVAADKVFIAPRDHTGVMALESTTGRLLWESVGVPSGQIIGVSGQVLLTQGDGVLAAINPATGANIWTKALDDARSPRAIVAGEYVLVAAGNRLLRFLASTGAVADELRLNGEAGAAFVLLADGSLAEFVEEPLPDPVEHPGSVAGPLRLPLAEQWSLPCESPLLVSGPAGGAGTSIFGILSDRLLLCVDAQRGHIVWQSRLPNRPDSVGFHGNLVLAAHDRTLTALNAASGATEWVLRLPFCADIVGGDASVLFAGELTKAGTVAAIEPGTGKTLWQKSFGDDPRLAGGRLEWIRLQGEAAGPPLLHVYWNSASFGNEGNRPAEVVVDAASGGVREVKRFLPGEPQWPSQIAFSDVRTYVRLRQQPPWPSRGPFLPDAIAYVGDGARAHFALLTQGQDLYAGLKLVMDVRPEIQYWSSAGLHPTAAGPFVRRIGRLDFFDATNSCTTYELPRNIPARTACNILDFRVDTGTVMVVSGSGSALPESTGERYQPYQWNGLQDCTGKGLVSLKCFKGLIQIGHSTMQLPEAGSNPTATLLNGQVKQHYQSSRIRMSNISSLGWSKYDVYLYGFGGTVAIEGVATQKCATADYSQAVNRTTFIHGVNYVKFAGVTGNAFTLDFSESAFSAIQIVNTSPSASKDKPEGLGVNWTGGGPGLLPTDVVGAEVACGNWYNINEYDLISGGLTTPQLARAVMSVDVFDRATGRLTGTQELPGARARARGAGYTDQARLLDGGLLTTDAMGVYFLRSKRTDANP